MNFRWLDELRSQAEAFERRLQAAQLDNLRGVQASVGLTATYEAAGELASRQTFERLAEALEGAPAEGGPVSARQLAVLLEYVGTNIERRAAAPANDRRLELEASRTVDVDGQRLGYRALAVEIQLSDERARRAALARAATAVEVELAPLVAEAQARARAAAAEAGDMDDYVRWRSWLSRFDIDALAAEAEALLRATDDVAREALAWLLRGRVEETEVAALAPHDLSRASRAVDLDGRLAPGELWRVDDFLRRVGLDPEGGGQIRRDTEARPHKSARAFCVAVRVPGEVHMVLQPARGLPAWRGLLHETGHALHLTGIDAALPFELRRLGDSSITEGYAVLFDHLLLNPVWTRRVLKLSVEDADRLARVAAAAALLITRRHSAKLIHEVALHRGDPDAPALYHELLRRATGVAPQLEGHLCDVDPEFYSSRYLRAWMFEGLAHRQLRERFDEDWFLNPRAGAALGALFAQGQQLELHELAQRELDGDLGVEAVVRRFEEVLG